VVQTNSALISGNMFNVKMNSGLIVNNLSNLLNVQDFADSTSEYIDTISSIASTIPETLDLRLGLLQAYHILIEYRIPIDGGTFPPDRWLGYYEYPTINNDPTKNGISVFLHTNQNEAIAYTIDYLSGDGSFTTPGDDIHAVRISFALKEDLARMKLIYSVPDHRRKPTSDEIKITFRRGSPSAFTDLYTPTVIEINNASGYGPADDTSHVLYETWLPLSPAVIDLLGFFRQTNKQVSDFQISGELVVNSTLSTKNVIIDDSIYLLVNDVSPYDPNWTEQHWCNVTPFGLRVQADVSGEYPPTSSGDYLPIHIYKKVAGGSVVDVFKLENGNLNNEGNIEAGGDIEAGGAVKANYMEVFGSEFYVDGELFNFTTVGAAIDVKIKSNPYEAWFQKGVVIEASSTSNVWSITYERRYSGYATDADVEFDYVGHFIHGGNVESWYIGPNILNYTYGDIYDTNQTRSIRRALEIKEGCINLSKRKDRTNTHFDGKIVFGDIGLWSPCIGEWGGGDSDYLHLHSIGYKPNTLAGGDSTPGKIYHTGDFVQLSDSRFKSNLRLLKFGDNELKMLDGIDIWSFTMHDPATGLVYPSMGFVAQQMLAAGFDEKVVETHGMSSGPGDDERPYNGYYQVNDNRVQFYMAKCMKQMNRKMIKMQSSILSLQTQLAMMSVNAPVQ